jgi:phosphohistidine swiveling domain-containing protein
MLDKMFMIKIRDLDLKSVKTPKLHGMIRLSKVDVPSTANDAYYVTPRSYSIFAAGRKFPKEFEEEGKKVVSSLLDNYGKITLRTGFWYEEQPNPLGLPSYRNLKSWKEIKKSIVKAYEEGEELAKKLKSKNYELGLILQGRLDAFKGGTGVCSASENFCYISSCFGDACLITSGEDIGDVYIVEKMEILQKVIKSKTYAYFFRGGKKIKRRLPEKISFSPSLSDEEVKKISNYGLKISKIYGIPIIMEFLFTKDGRIDIYDVQPLPGEITTYTYQKYTPASLGRTKGKVQFLSGKEKIRKNTILAIPAGKFSETEILEMIYLYEPKAILMSSGGISSNIAIAARERKIPLATGFTEKELRKLEDKEITLTVEEHGINIIA